MIELERHIEILLLGNDCVIVPGLGGFMAHHVDARYDEGDGLFLPPLRTLGFNPQLTMNDSLLVQSYIEAFDVSYPEALRRIEAEVAELRQHIETEGFYELNDIGVLRLNEEGHLLFTPCEAGILTPGLYGLGSFEMEPLEASKPAVVTPALTAEKPAEHTITIKMSWLRNVAAVAAAVIASLMIGTPVSNSEEQFGKEQQSSFIPILAQEKTVEESPKEATETEIKVTDMPLQAEKVEPQTKQKTPAYCIVLASLVSRQNAKAFICQLEEQGLHDAYVIEGKFLRVGYGNYDSYEQAKAQLIVLKMGSSQFQDAWVLEMKK